MLNKIKLRVFSIILIILMFINIIPFNLYYTNKLSYFSGSSAITTEEDEKISMDIHDPNIKWIPIEDTLDPSIYETKINSNSIEGDSIRYITKSGNEVIEPETTLVSLSDILDGFEGIQILAEDYPESVIPPDDRQRITPTTSFPWSSIVKLYMRWGSNYYIASGAVIDSFHVLTAGHCVYSSSEGGWADEIIVVPAKDGAIEPFGIAYVTLMRTVTGWTISESYQHDFAVVTLDRTVGYYTGWMGRQTASPSDPIYTDVLNTAGYPADLDSGVNMYFDSDYGNSADEYNHWYWMDTYGGQSGSAVWRYDGSNRYILTVHAYGAGGIDPNFGTRLNDNKFNLINNWLLTDAVPDLMDRGGTYSGFTPSSVVAGSSSFDVWCDVTNAGTTDAGSFTISYYASSDNIISTSDYLLGSDIISSLSALSSTDSSWNGIFPDIVPDGTYYIGWIIDSNDNIIETGFEYNNIGLATDQVIVSSEPGEIDLRDRGNSYSGFTPSSVIAGSSSFDVWCDVENIGNIDAGSFDVTYYISVDDIISTSDYILGTDIISGIPPASYSDSSWSGTFPDSIPDGTYFVGWIIDSNDVISETDENNNIGLATDQLIVSSMPDEIDLRDGGNSYSGFSPSNVISGSSSFSIWCDIENIGNTDAESFDITYYVSSDEIISTSDYVLGNDIISGILSGSYFDSSWSGTFPSTVPNGIYYIGWIIDSSNVISEFNETNNIGLASGIISVGPISGIIAEFQSGSAPILDGDLSDSFWSGVWDVYEISDRLISIKVKHNKENLYFAVQWIDNDDWDNDIRFYFEDDGFSPDRSLDEINDDCKYAGASFGEGNNRDFADAHWTPSSSWVVTADQRHGLYSANNEGNIWYVEAYIPLSTNSIYDIDVTSPEILGFSLFTYYALPWASYPVGADVFDASTWSYLHVHGPFNIPPEVPKNPTPDNGATGISINPSLNVDVSDENGDDLNVTFYDASDDSIIGIDIVTGGSGTATTNWLSLSPGTTYSWYAISDDGFKSIQSDNWMFTTNYAPDLPSNPSPSDGASNTNYSPTLSVDVTDPDDDLMDVSFYNATDDNLIGTVFGVPSGDTASIMWSGLSEGTTYSWYTVANDGISSTTSLIWSFTTNYGPNAPTNPSPGDGETGVILNPTLSVDVSDPDGDSMDISFYNTSDNSLIGTAIGVPSGDTASIMWPDLSEGTMYSWYAVANDGTSSTTSSIWSFTTNYAPNAPTNPSPGDGETGVILNPTLSVDISDPDDDFMNISFYNASDNSLIGTVFGVSSGDTASIPWSSLSEGTIYGWYVIISDSILISTSPIWSFTTYFDTPVWDQTPGDQIIEFGNNLVYDLNASDLSGIHHWWINDTSNFNIDSNGIITNTVSLAVEEYWLEVRAYDPYNYYCTATIKIIVDDSTVPMWDQTPTNQIIEFGDELIYDLNASDLSGIDHWWINDTSNFNIDSNGIITNTISLPVGEYWLEVRAYDPYNNYCTATIKIIVEDTTTPTWDSTPTDQVIEFGDNLLYDLNALDLSGIDYWWINDTYNFNIDSNGIITNAISLPVGEYWLEIRAYDPYNNYCIATIKITVEDTTAPTWDSTPTDQVIEFGDNLLYDLNALDLSGIDYWWINDTYNFNIDGNGIITNVISLAVGEYWLEVRAYDAYNNYCIATIKITVMPKPEGITDYIIPGFDILVVMGVLIGISMLLIKKRFKSNF